MERHEGSESEGKEEVRGEEEENDKKKEELKERGFL